MLWGHGTGGVRKSWPDFGGIERVVWNKQLIRDHGKPDLFFLASADAHHATVIVEGQASGLAVWPEALNGGEVEITGPGVIDGLVWENGVETTAITNVHDEIEKMRTNRRNDHGTGSVDEEMVVQFEAVTSRQEAKGTLDVVATVKAREGGEFGYGYGRVVEHGDVGVGIKGDAMVIDGSLNLVLLRSIPGGEMEGYLCGIIWNVMTTFVDEGGVIIVVPVYGQGEGVEGVGWGWGGLTERSGADHQRHLCQTLRWYGCWGKKGKEDIQVRVLWVGQAKRGGKHVEKG